MEKLIQVFSGEEIKASISQVAEQISEDYRDKNPILIGVLKGAFIFLADLVRALSIPCRVDFIRAASYGDSRTSSGRVRITGDVELDLKDAHVILVEDIIDTGITLSRLVKHLENHGAASVKICALLDKYECRVEHIAADYVCHRIPKGFIVGYGMDCAESFRGLPAMYYLKS